MLKRKTKDTEEAAVPEPVIAEEAPDVWPENTNPKVREIMESHGIMGPKQMDSDWARAESIFASHGFAWKAPE